VAASASALARPRREGFAGTGGRRRGRLIVGSTLVGLFAATALLAPWLAPYDPAAVPAALSDTMLRPPEVAHPLGTDALGRDLLSRVLYGGRVSLALGLGVEVVIAALGVAIGLLAGYYGGWRDSLLMRVTDVVMAFPSLILAIGLIAVFEQPGLDKVALVLVALGWTTIARVVRGEVLSLKERDYVQAARALGVGHTTVLLRHLLPNAVGPIIVAATIGVGSNMKPASLFSAWAPRLRPSRGAACWPRARPSSSPPPGSPSSPAPPCCSRSSASTSSATR
jgi:peptide/nickel transport system permease protein